MAVAVGRSRVSVAAWPAGSHNPCVLYHRNTSDTATSSVGCPSCPGAVVASNKYTVLYSKDPLGIYYKRKRNYYRLAQLASRFNCAANIHAT